MQQGDVKRQRNIKRLVAGLNMIPNLLWSIMCFTPVVVFCYSHVDRTVLCGTVAIGLLTGLLPRSFFERIRLSNSAIVYRRLGLDFFNRFTQNGTIINKVLKKWYPDYCVVYARKQSVQTFLRQSYLFEKFHFILLIIFLLLTLNAVLSGYNGWALVLLTLNLVYNVYPILLQQYLQLRLSRFIKE